MFEINTPIASITSPQSPGVSTVKKLRAMALLQHPAAVELVVEEVLDVDELLDEEVLEVDVDEVDDVEDVDVLEVLDVDVDVDEVLDVDDVDVDDVVVLVVPATGHPAGAGASFLLRSPTWFLMFVPPNSAQ